MSFREGPLYVTSSFVHGECMFYVHVCGQIPPIGSSLPVCPSWSTTVPGPNIHVNCVLHWSLEARIQWLHVHGGCIQQIGC